MRPIRVIHVLGGLSRGGTETWFIQAARRLVQMGYELDVLVFQAKEEGAYAEEARDIGVAIQTIAQPTNLFEFVAKIRGLLDRKGPYDIVHSHIWYASGAVMYAASKANVSGRIVHSRNTDDRHQRSFKRWSYETFMRRLINRFATHAVAITEDAGQSLFGKRHWAAHGIVIPTSIDLTPFKNLSIGRESRHQFSIPSDAFVVGHVGRFVPQKNHEFVVRVFEQLLHKVPNSYLLLIGDGELLGATRTLVHNLGLTNRVMFAGLHHDVPRVMLGAMDLLLFPSKWEGFGRVIVEAQAAGLPCLISDNLPRESDIVPGLVHRLSLKENAESWATAAVESRNISSSIDKCKALSLVEASPINIEKSVTGLDMLYRRAAFKHSSSGAPL